MKPGVLFELKNIGRPLAWIQKIRFVSVKRYLWGVKFLGHDHRTCLIWKPELFEPKVRR